MLQQSVRRTARSAAAVALCAPVSCKVCAGQCDATFRSNRYNGVQMRYAATSRRSPASLDQRDARKRQREHDGAVAASARRTTLSFLERRHDQGLFSTPPEKVARFLSQFIDRMSKSVESSTIGAKRMREIMDENAITDKESWMIPHLLFVNGDMSTGKRMLLSLSRAGVEEATIRVMAYAVLEARKKPDKLRAKELAYSRLHLSQIASEKRNFRAMVCEGKVARTLGDEARAIEMWTDAMAAAIEYTERQEQARQTIEKTGGGNEVDRDPLELSSPWIELMLLHRERSERRGKDEMRQCRWAMEIGCKQDDPTSFYHASTFVKQHDSSGNHIPTAEWLYYVTKAAASSHPMAAYQLAKFYAESGWKYLEDEPPDHVKPTPFDSFPTEKRSSLVNRILSLVGLVKRPEMKAEESIFHNAAFPYTAAERYALAFEWLDVAISYAYAPACLYQAQLLMQKSLWGLANAPQTALDMSAARYSYASKEDYEAGTPIEKPVDEEPADPPNPYYSLAEAQTWLREVFYAHEAYHYTFEVKKAYTIARREGRAPVAEDEDDLLNEEVFRGQGFRVYKWFRFPEVREMYEHEIEGLYVMAKRICDEQGWDVYDDDGGLIYKAGSRQKRAVRRLHFH